MKPMSAKLKNRVRNVSKALNKVVRDQITEQDHVDTGKMRASITSEVKFTSKGFELEITGLEYFAYVSGRYDIMKNVFASRKYKTIEKEIEAIFYDYIADQIPI